MLRPFRLITAIKEICSELQADYEEICNGSKAEHILRIRNAIIYELLMPDESGLKLYSNGEIAEFFKKDISGIRKIISKQKELYSSPTENSVILEYRFFIHDKLRDNKLID